MLRSFTCIVSIGTFSFFLALSSVDAQPSNETLIHAMALLDEASNKRNYEQILQARSILEEISAVDSLAVWAHYYSGAASSALANLIDEGIVSARRGDLAGHINNGIAHLEAAVRIDPGFADAWILLSTSYAHKISVRPFKLIGLRRRYNRAMSKAIELEPNNPRVILLRAIMDYSLPGIAGGDKVRAEEGFNLALSILAEENITHPYQPKWGLDQAHARLGVIYMDRGDLVSARESFEQSLQINSDYGWVLEDLIPALEQLESES